MTPDAPAQAGPIADLSYRNYDGPLHSRSARWWIVAVSGIRLTMHNRWYWLLTLLAAGPYLLFGVVYYFMHLATQQASGAGAMAMGPLLREKNGHQYAMLFYQCMTSFSPTWLFGISLLVGAGSIASDNRANALQVYLSKPITKGDYLLGKWVSVFLPVALAALAPALLLYAFMGMAFSTEGFFHKEPLLGLRILGACLVPGVIHASLLMGFSAWSKTARLAGAFYAGVFFVGDILQSIIRVATFVNGVGVDKNSLLQHMSIGGVITGLGQAIYGVTIQRPMVFRHRGAFRVVSQPPPDAWVLLAIAIVVCVAAVAAARWRIRAVEVVRG